MNKKDKLVYDNVMLTTDFLNELEDGTTKFEYSEKHLRELFERMLKNLEELKKLKEDKEGGKNE